MEVVWGGSGFVLVRFGDVFFVWGGRVTHFLVNPKQPPNHPIPAPKDPPPHPTPATPRHTPPQRPWGGNMRAPTARRRPPVARILPPHGSSGGVGLQICAYDTTDTIYKLVASLYFHLIIISTFIDSCLTSLCTIICPMTAPQEIRGVSAGYLGDILPKAALGKPRAKQFFDNQFFQ